MVCYCVFTDKDIYVCGGEVEMGRNSWCMDVHCYRSESAKWHVVSQLPHPRRHHTALAWDKYLYLLGGNGRHRVILDRAERLNTHTGKSHLIHACQAIT